MQETRPFPGGPSAIARATPANPAASTVTFTVTYDYSRMRLNQNGLGGYLDRIFCNQTIAWTAK